MKRHRICAKCGIKTHRGRWHGKNWLCDRCFYGEKYAPKHPTWQPENKPPRKEKTRGRK